MQAKSAIVTGGSRGIGAGICAALAQAGYDVVINYATNLEAVKKVARQVESFGRQALPLQADISQPADRARLVEAAVASFGKIDLLVNNAGVAPTERADILKAGEESFDRVIGVNLKGPYFLTQLVARDMIARKVPGKILNITSISAYTASTNRGDYCISKAGLSMTTKLWAARLAEHGINVYEIRPGIILTDMSAAAKEKYDKLIGHRLTPIARWGTADDVAKAVVAIATELLPFSTGEVINVDGGFHLRSL